MCRHASFAAMAPFKDDDDDGFDGNVAASGGADNMPSKRIFQAAEPPTQVTEQTRENWRCILLAQQGASEALKKSRPHDSMLYDFLKVEGAAPGYSGTVGPNIGPLFGSGIMTWTSDYGGQKSGWKLCGKACFDMPFAAMQSYRIDTNRRYSNHTLEII